MMDQARSWARVQLAMDERRDPLDDELLQEWFADHPEALADYTRLEQRLTDLASRETLQIETLRTPADPRRRLLELAATIAATILAVVAARHLRVEDALQSTTQRFDPAPSRVVEYRLTATRSDGERAFRASRSLDGPLHITNTLAETHTNGAGRRPRQHDSQTETTR